VGTALDTQTHPVADDDRGYAGSRYSDVVAAIFANPYQRVWGGAGEPALPVHEVTFTSVFGGLIFGATRQFLTDCERTLDSGADLRWGKDRKGFPRLVHPNGICLTGRWQITEDTPYSGYFRKDSTALIVARYSTCCTETRRGNTRSLSMVGKLFPTTDPHDTRPHRTANFMTQEDIGGAKSAYINDADLRNAPDITVANRGVSGFALLTRVGMTFGKVDREGTQRQLYQIAELGKPPGEPTRTPQFMRLHVSARQPKIEGASLDFRDEIMAQIFDRGDPSPKRTLTFDIEVTDDGQSSGPAARLRRTFKNWKRIGALVFDNAVVSYNGDRVIHFSHPKWRDDRNDPATAARVDGKLVR
jgi:hypothetical protein